MAACVDVVGNTRKFVVYSDYPGVEEQATGSVVCDWQHAGKRETRTLGLYVGDNPQHRLEMIEKGKLLISQVPNLAPGETLNNVRVEKL